MGQKKSKNVLHNIGMVPYEDRKIGSEKMVIFETMLVHVYFPHGFSIE